MLYSSIFQVFALTLLYTALPLQAKNTRLDRRREPHMTIEKSRMVIWDQANSWIIIGFPYLYTTQNWDRISGYKQDLTDFVNGLATDSASDGGVPEYELLGFTIRYLNFGANPHYAIRIQHPEPPLGWFQQTAGAIARHNFPWYSQSGQLLQTRQVVQRQDSDRFLVQSKPELHVETDNSLLIITADGLEPRAVIVVFPFLANGPHEEDHSAKMKEYESFIQKRVQSSFELENPQVVPHLVYESATYTIRFKDLVYPELRTLLIREVVDSNANANARANWHITTARFLERIFSPPQPGHTPAYETPLDQGRVFKPRLELRKDLVEEYEEHLRLWLD